VKFSISDLKAETKRLTYPKADQSFSMHSLGLKKPDLYPVTSFSSTRVVGFLEDIFGSNSGFT